HQFEYRLLVYAHVLHFKVDTLLRKVALRPGARRSTGLAIDHDSLSLHSFPSSACRSRCTSDSCSIAALHFFWVSSASWLTRWISVVMCAVLFSMAATPQYFSSERRTASSTALRETCPVTV